MALPAKLPAACGEAPPAGLFAHDAAPRRVETRINAKSASRNLMAFVAVPNKFNPEKVFQSTVVAFMQKLYREAGEAYEAGIQALN